MNNRGYYADNLAYDFDMFLPKEKRNDNVVKIKRENKSSKQDKHMAASQPAKQTANKSQSGSEAAGSVASKIGALMFTALILSILCLNIYLRVQITETTAKIDSAQNQLDKEKSEEVRLEMELEKCISLKNLEQSAKALGMHKKEKYQVEYITVNTGDKAEVVNSKKSDVLTMLSDNINNKE